MRELSHFYGQLQGKFDSTPYVVVTAEHMVKDQKHDAATTWVEEATADSFKVCLRELQDFDGLHSKIYIVSRNNISDINSVAKKRTTMPTAVSGREYFSHALDK